MKKKFTIALILIISMFCFVGCGHKEEPAPEQGTVEETKEVEEPAEEAEEGNETAKVADSSEMTEVEDVVQDWMVPIHGSDLVDGSYDINVDSSSSMFKIESCKLNVKNGEMSADMTMGGKGYLYLFMGTGEEAVAADESEYIHFTENSEGNHVYTVPIDALDAGIDCAAFSKNKEKWYERTLVFRSDLIPVEGFRDGIIKTASTLGISDGEYQANIELSGGSGKASIESPTKVRLEDGTLIATITWSSPNYDYMVVDGEKYLPINTEGNSVFEIPIKAIDRFVPVIADTIAMSQPHEIDYMIRIDSASITNLE